MTPAHSRDSASPRWYHRVVPTTALAVLVLALATVLLPDVRDELALSVTRRTVPHVELYFSGATERAAEEGCPRGGTVRVKATVRSHLGEAATVPYRVALRPDGRPARVRTGTVALPDGGTAVLRERLRVRPGAGYVVRVVLPGHEEHLRLRCAGDRR